MHDDVLGDVEMVGESGKFYLIVNGIKIARRDHCRWTNLVPGYSVEDLDGGARIAIDVDGSKLPRPIDGSRRRRPAAHSLFVGTASIVDWLMRVGRLAFQ